jgi:hypothetical protein
MWSRIATKGAAYQWKEEGHLVPKYNPAPQLFELRLKELSLEQNRMGIWLQEIILYHNC